MRWLLHEQRCIARTPSRTDRSAEAWLSSYAHDALSTGYIAIYEMKWRGEWKLGNGW